MFLVLKLSSSNLLLFDIIITTLFTVIINCLLAIRYPCNYALNKSIGSRDIIMEERIQDFHRTTCFHRLSSFSAAARIPGRKQN